MASKTPQYGQKVKEILDATKPRERVCELSGEKWDLPQEEIDYYRKFNVPPSKYSIDYRFYVMTCFWLTFSWWWNKHIETGKRILTYIHPATGIRVMPDNEWFDSDFTDRGREIDFERPFFDQMRELQLAVPQLANRHYKKPENSIAMFSHGDVNSYFVMFSSSKNSLFGEGTAGVETSAEFMASSAITNVYNCIDVHRLHDCKFVRSSRDCVRCDFVFDCRNCENCFGAWNKRNKKYLWWNEQLSQEEWKKRRAEVDLTCRSKMQEQFDKFQKALSTETVWPENFNDKNENSTGEYLNNTTNMTHCYAGSKGARDCYHVLYAFQECYDNAFCASTINSNNCYRSVNATSCSEVMFSDSCQDSINLEYCLQCFNCENCFGCVGLNRKKFCIFNKQYTEDEYWIRLDELKCWMLEQGSYGEFFPASMGVNPWSRCGAKIYLAPPKGVGKTIGAPVFDESEDGALGELDDSKNARPSSEVPDCINDVKDEDIVGKPFYDEKERRYFAFIQPELNLYRKLGLPLPDRHFMDRMNTLSIEENSARFIDIRCSACNKDIMTAQNATYPERQIYCKECYLKYLEQYG